MISQTPIVFKAYTATGLLLVSKPIHPDDHSRILDIYQDMRSTGVLVYFTKQGRISRKHLLKAISYARFGQLKRVHPGSNL